MENDDPITELPDMRASEGAEAVALAQDAPPAPAAPTATATVAAEVPLSSYPDDGHIFVCVRVRDVPSHQCLADLSANAGGGELLSPGKPPAKAALKDAQKICLSTIENVVIMHDPRQMDDKTVAKDANSVVQALSERGRPSQSTTKGRRSSGAGVRARSGRKKGATLVSTSTANFYECDKCITSMDEATMLKMPIVRTSDFLQPPAYGSQEDVYLSTAQHAVTAAVEGVNSCVFAYGQTGSGKTYTLFGDTNNIRRDPGIVPRTLDDLFRRLEGIRTNCNVPGSDTDYSYSVQISFFEIYQNDVFCLLTKKRQGPLSVRFDRDNEGKKETMVIKDLLHATVTSAERAYPLIEQGLHRRQTGETGMNAHSSRSHAILQIRVSQSRSKPSTKETMELHATVNLVDLAGSERQKTAQTSGKSREEGIQINQSLATLARVINDISSGAKFVNYRDSLLTMVLRDNLGGNSRTFMIATVSPCAFSYQESCATLVYAKDVRKIRNRPTVNKSFQTRANLLEQFARVNAENARLRDQMEALMKTMHSNTGAQKDASANHSFALRPRRDAGEEGDTDGGDPLGDASGLEAAGSDAWVRARSAIGLTAPLIVSSHRQYTSLAGIGGTCVGGGVARVTALTADMTELSVKDILEERAPQSHRQGEPLDGDKDDDKENGGVRTSAAAAVAADTSGDMGYLRLERLSQRSCEQRYYAYYVPPEDSGDGTAPPPRFTVRDIQVNGRGIGVTSRRELSHGDVICVFIEQSGSDSDDKDNDGEKSGEESQDEHLLTFHFVDLNALARTTALVDSSSTTLGQLAVSTDLPDGLENLTLDGVQQLQRDNAKLLDMVRQQADTLNYRRMQTGLSSRLSSVSMHNSAASPDPLRFNSSRSRTPETAVPVKLEAFRRLSVSPSIRGRSALPHDLDAEELLNRADEQSASRAHADGGVKSKFALERERLMQQLAELESGGGAVDGGRHSGDADTSNSPSCTNNTNNNDDDDHDDAVKEKCESPANGTRATALSLAGTDGAFFSVSRETSQVGPSVLRVSSSSSSDDDGDENDDKGGAANNGGEEPEAVPGGHTAEAVSRPQEGNVHIYFENTEGERERFRAALRDKQQRDRISELEDLIADLRAQLALMETRLRIASEDGLELDIMRGEAVRELETVRQELTEELDGVKAENEELVRDNAALEEFLRKAEESLSAATAFRDAEEAGRAEVMAQQMRALRELARLWKRRAMKYIAMGYGSVDEVNSDRRLEEIPWEELRAGATAALAKRRLLGDAEDGGAVGAAVEEFEEATALEAVRALESVLEDLEQQNQQLHDDVRRYEAALKECEELIDRLRREKESLERELGSASATEEESRKLKKRLDATVRQLDEAEKRVASMRDNVDAAKLRSKDNKRKAAAKSDVLLAQHRQIISELESRLALLSDTVRTKDEELGNLLRYMEDNQMTDADGVLLRDMELRGRVEELIADALRGYEAPNAYSAFPQDFVFSDDMVALIRVCLRVLLDRLKVELYVLNKQNMHKLELLVPSVQLRPEARFHSFMHDLRGVVVDMAGRAQRIGGKWTLSEGDVLSELVDHRRRRAGGALFGLLIWYDHWDLSPKAEHVCYMELIRNGDRILQMARLVRQESALNTNATSTLNLPVPAKRKGASDVVLSASPASGAADSSISESRRILSQLSGAQESSNLARAVAAEATPTRDRTANPFSRSATALVLSQTTGTAAFSRTASAIGGALSPQQHASSGNKAAEAVTPPHPTHLTPPSRAAGLPKPPAGFARSATGSVLPVSENDVNYVASSDVAQAESLQSYNASRRKSAAAAQETGTANNNNKFGRRRSSAAAFSRSQTDIPLTTTAFSRKSSLAAVPARPSDESKERKGRGSVDARRPSTGTAASKKVKAASGGKGGTDTCFGRSQTALHTRMGGAGLTSPKPRLSAAAAAAKLSKETPSFYNPSVLQALRERSCSDSNKVAKKTVGKKKKKATGPNGAAAPFKSTKSRLTGSTSPLSTPRLSTASTVL